MRGSILAALLLLAFAGTAGADTFVATPIAPTWTSYQIDGTRPFDYGVETIVESHGAVWFALNYRGVWRFAEGKWEDCTEAVGARSIRAIVPGSDGTLWFTYDKSGGVDWGTMSKHDLRDQPAGVTGYKDGQWKRYEMPRLFKGNGRIHSSVYSSRDGSLWFFIDDHVVRFRDGSWSLVEGIEQPARFHEDANGGIWISVKAGPIWYASRPEDAFAPLNVPDIDLSHPTGFAAAKDGTVWIGAKSGLVEARNGRYIRHATVASPVTELPDGSLLASTKEGFAFLRDGKWLPAPFSKLHDSDRNVWFSADGRVHRYQEGEWKGLPQLPADVAVSTHGMFDAALEAADGAIWVRTDAGGVARYNGSQWVTIFPASQDVPPAVEAWCAASDGSVWLGYTSGEIRRFVPSKGALAATPDASGLQATLEIERGRKPGPDWKIAYGYSTVADAAPKTTLTLPLDEDGRVLLPVPRGGTPLYVRGHAFDADGTIVPLRDASGNEVIAFAGSGAAAQIADEVEVEYIGTLEDDFETVYLDGQPLPAGSFQVRGGGSAKKVVAKRSLLSQFTDGFHELNTTLESYGSAFAVFKDKQKLKLWKPYARSVAVIIAVSKYPADADYGTLAAAEPQAKSLEAYLKTQGFQTRTLYGPQATKAAIERLLLEDLSLGPNDRLLVYFGGHGGSEPDAFDEETGYLIPYDGKKARLTTTAIPLTDLVTRYSRLIKAKHVLFVLDSCQAGLASRGEPTANDKKRKAFQEIFAYSRERGRAILAAGTGGESALDKSGGIFTRAFLDGIKGAADRSAGDKNGVVDFYELYVFVKNRVADEASRINFKQTPSIFIPNEFGSGRFFFITDRALEK